MSIQRSDLLLELLQQYEAERAAFDASTDEQLSDEEWSRIAEETWYGTQSKILALKPPVTTAAGAVRVLGHVLRNEDLWEPDRSADQQLLWLLIKSASDFIARLSITAPDPSDHLPTHRPAEHSDSTTR